MGPAARKPQAALGADSAPSPTWPLRGLYLFLAVAVGCVGASAGELFFLDYAPLSNRFAAVTNRCVLLFPIETRSQELDSCWAGAYRSQGWVALGWAVATLVLTAGLILIVPWLDRWRLARAARFSDIRGRTTTAAARFRSLCAEAGLAGRRSPDLLIAAVPEAFTTVLPGGRPLVVLPVKVALGCDDPTRFDPVVLHELAHVRMRDVSLASAVRGISCGPVAGIIRGSERPAEYRGGMGRRTGPGRPTVAAAAGPTPVACCAAHRPASAARPGRHRPGLRLRRRRGRGHGHGCLLFPGREL
jgi:hypothetical protein